ncbi:hypothetical protein H0H92_006215, partial [Tricholoma furcatifolium]
AEIISRLDSAKAENNERLAAQERRRYVKKMLSKHSVVTPTYDTEGKFPCAEGTRVGVLQSITQWIWDVRPGQTSKNFFWLSGNPGCGKSSITASVTKECKAEDVLWAQFFINRNNSDTTNPNVYFPTIAQQLSRRSEDVEREIHDQLKANRALLDGVSSEQAARLFIDAVRVASRLDLSKPVVVVIDGFDEMDRRHMRSTAQIFAQLFGALPDCPNVKVFISSRTDNDIQTPFAAAILGNPHVRNLHLNTNHPSSIHDVTLYLRKQLALIVLNHDLDWNHWPGEAGFDALAAQASGLFIWAATAVKFFQQQIDDWGQERLPLLLADLNGKGMIDIDALYGFIIFSTYANQLKNERDAEWACETFRRLVGAIVVLCEPLPLDSLHAILDLRETPSSPAVDVVHLVRRLRTVLIAEGNSIHGQTVPVLHKSFYEFIVSGRAESRFRVDLKKSHFELGMRCLHALSKTKTAISTWKMPRVYRYSCRFWSQHLLQALGSFSGILIAPSPGIHSLSALNRTMYHSSIASPPINLMPSGSSVMASISGISCGWNVSDGLSMDKASLALGVKKKSRLRYAEPYNPLSHDNALNLSAVQTTMGKLGNLVVYATVYAPAMMQLEPTRKIGLWNTGDGISKDPISETIDCGEWSTARSIFQNGHFAEVRKSAIHIWNVKTADNNNSAETMLGSISHISEIQSSILPSYQKISCLALSSTGRYLAIGSFDGVLLFWDVQEKKAIQSSRSTPRNASEITAISFSPDGIRVISCSITDIILWTFSMGKFCQSSSLTCSPGTAFSVAFSLDSRIILTGHAHGTIVLWDTTSGEQIKSLKRLDPPKQLHCDLGVCSTNNIVLLQFSNGAESIISGTEGGNLDLWDVESGQCIASSVIIDDSAQGISACFLSKDQICAARGYEMRVFGVRGDYLRLTCWEGLTLKTESRLRETVCAVHEVRLGDLVQKMDDEVVLPKQGPKKGQLLKVLAFAFSLDGQYIVTLSLNPIMMSLTMSPVIYLWNAFTGELVASASHDITPELERGLAHANFDYGTNWQEAVFFTPDNRFVTVVEGVPLSWELSNGRLISRDLSSSESFVSFFEEHDFHVDASVTYNNSQWIPSKSTGVDFWAFIDNHIIRANKDGSLIIAQLSDARLSMKSFKNSF